MSAGKKSIFSAVGGVSLLLLAGCATQPQNEQFGESVRHMIEAQTYPVPDGMAARPSTLNGQMAEEAIRVYREGPQPGAVSPMMIELVGATK